MFFILLRKDESSIFLREKTSESHSSGDKYLLPVNFWNLRYVFVISKFPVSRSLPVTKFSFRYINLYFRFDKNYYFRFISSQRQIYIRSKFAIIPGVQIYIPEVKLNYRKWPWQPSDLEFCWPEVSTNHRFRAFFSHKNILLTKYVNSVINFKL